MAIIKVGIPFMSKRRARRQPKMPTPEGPSPTSTQVHPSTPPAPSIRDVFVSRQPIYDQQLEAFAYSLLFHSNDVKPENGMEPYHTTSQMLSNLFMEIGLEAVVGQKRALFRLTRGFILLDYTRVFPADRVVLEISPHTPIDADLLDAVRSLSSQGYAIALPDVFTHEHLRPLLEVAGLVKIDLHACDRATIQDRVAQLRPHQVRLLAVQVDSHDDVAFCQDLGFDYVQGFFFCQPDVLKKRGIPTNRMTVLQLLAKLLHPDTDFTELEAIISRDVSLSYRLLRLINSSFFGLSSKITSIRQALLLLGIRQITTWVSLMALAGIDDKPHELTITAMVRAKMCELLAEATEHDGKDTFFLVGLLSVLDALMDSPLETILNALPLADDVTQALLHHQGTLGLALGSVLAYERGYWDAVNDLGLDRGTITDAYLHAIAWTAERHEVV
jgi:EAL and modified HD-GYP domain-containing signal transduction protein